MTTPIATTRSNSQMHNDIMAAGSKEHPLMLAAGRYAQWSRFLRYVDTKPNKKELRQCIFDGPYVMIEITIPAKPKPTTEEAVPEHIIVETYKNTTLENHAYFDVEAKAIHMILSGIGGDIYSTVDACTTAKEMWIAIERLQQGESLNKQDVKTNLFWEFGKFTSRDGESIESYYSKFYKMMNEMIRNKLEVATMNANSLTLVAATQQFPDTYYKAQKTYKPYAPSSKQTPSTRSYTPTRNTGKEIAKAITPPSESASEEDKDNDPEQAQRDKDMQKNLALIPKKPKWAKDYAYHKEKMMVCKQEEKGVPLSAEQGDWLNDTDEKPDE
ncbi:hypothetical protein Tco_0946457 [Tanacetum coccineum]